MRQVLVQRSRRPQLKQGKVLTKYSNEVVSYITRLTAAEVENSVSGYAQYLITRTPKKEMTQSELARLIGIPQSTASTPGDRDHRP